MLQYIWINIYIYIYNNYIAFANLFNLTLCQFLKKKVSERIYGPRSYVKEREHDVNNTELIYV